MITVGAIYELDFISQYFEDEVSFSIKVKGRILHGTIEDNKVRLKYKEQKIWEEEIHSEAIGFGIESCDRIHKIMECIDKDDKSWLTKYAWTQSDSVTQVPLSKAIKK
jgi:hypothetical protein